MTFRIEYYRHDEQLEAESCDRPLEAAQKQAMARLSGTGADRARILDMDDGGNVVTVIAA
jgi:hypothetical protein